MAGEVLPDCGGAWDPGEGGEGGNGSPPLEVMQILETSGRDGIVISGVVTWVIAQMDTHAVDIWKPLGERCFSDREVTAAKAALVKAGGETLKENKNIKPRNGGSVKTKKEMEMEDIRMILIALKGAGKMPLVLATSDQMTRCPQSWGVPTVQTTQDLAGKMAELEKAMSDNMEMQREQMVVVRLELAALRLGGGLPRTPTFNLERPDTPISKKRKFDLPSAQQESEVLSYSQVLGVTPLNENRNLNQKRVPLKPKQQKNICFGTEKSDNEFSADVSLVASGINKGCDKGKLTEYLTNKGIIPTEVELLTREEVFEKVRTLSFRVAFKASDYEAALKPEVWPYRVGVRHYRAPRREDKVGLVWTEQSRRSGGQQRRRSGQPGHHDDQPGGGGRYLPVGHPGLAKHQQQVGAGNQQQVGSGKQQQQQVHDIEISNLYSALQALNGAMGLGGNKQ